MKNFILKTRQTFLNKRVIPAFATSCALALAAVNISAAEPALQEQNITFEVSPEVVLQGSNFTLNLATVGQYPAIADIQVSSSGSCSQTSTYNFKAADSAGNCTISIYSEGNSQFKTFQKSLVVKVEALVQNQSIRHDPDMFVGFSAGDDKFISAWVEPNSSGASVTIKSTDTTGGVFYEEEDAVCAFGSLSSPDMSEQYDGGALYFLAPGTCSLLFSTPERTHNGITYLASSKLISFNVDRLSQEIVVDQAPPSSEIAGEYFVVKAYSKVHEGSNVPSETLQGLRLPAVTVEASSACEVINTETVEDVNALPAYYNVSATIRMKDQGQSCIVSFHQSGDDFFKPAQSLSYEVVLAQKIDEDDDISEHWTHYALFEAKTDSGQAQSITSPPMVARNGDLKANSPNLMVMFGTGMYHQTADLSDNEKNKVQSVYGVHDRGKPDATLVKSNLEIRTLAGDVSTNSEGQKLANRKIEGEKIAWSTKFGWYFDLKGGMSASETQYDSSLKAGERFVFRPFLSNQLFVFNTVIPVSGSCEGATQGWTMLLDWATGLAPDFATYDANLSKEIDGSDRGYVGFFNEVAGSELSRSGDNVFDTSGSEARVQSVVFGRAYDGVQIGWEEKRPFGVLKRNN